MIIIVLNSIHMNTDIKRIMAEHEKYILLIFARRQSARLSVMILLYNYRRLPQHTFNGSIAYTIRRELYDKTCYEEYHR